MMMKFAFVLACASVLILKPNLALICKRCNIADCNEPQDEECLVPGASQEVSCLTEIFSDAENSTNINFQKKCVIYEKGTNFECAPYPAYTSLSCSVCNFDLCNKEPTPAVVNRNTTIGGVIHQFNSTLNATNNKNNTV